MAWDFLHIVRQSYQGDSNWGDMYIKKDDGTWELLSYVYELPWKEDENGKSINNVSRIKIGTYELTVREDGKGRRLGGKGWRLELQNTGHRENIQIHRAAPSMFIEGCILPVHFNTLGKEGIKKGDIRIRNKSEEIMDKIKERLEAMKKKDKLSGNAAVTISANLPAKLVTNRSHVNV